MLRFIGTALFPKLVASAPMLAELPDAPMHSLSVLAGAAADGAAGCIGPTTLDGAALHAAVAALAGALADDCGPTTLGVAAAAATPAEDDCGPTSLHAGSVSRAEPVMLNTILLDDPMCNLWMITRRMQGHNMHFILSHFWMIRCCMYDEKKSLHLW